ncbi:hypothetical protein CVV68_17520 [Arthrobacter livingstonensis]|uniref:Uncharacterized protein n=1 Tax=Arthrobacter livingstonensis TaxID=670078 RepID=A0A2V5L7T7_9MICC|nr:hypothetical protein CVV68_17520 [Arthrobacter livingstonensis]
MRTWLVFIGASVVVWLSVLSLAQALPRELSHVSAIVNAGFVAAGCVGSILVRRHLARKNRTDDPDSVEPGLAQQARADAFGVGLVILALFGLYMFLTLQFANGVIVYGLMGLSAVAFWIRYSFLRSRVS